MTKILIIGATVFVGRSLFENLKFKKKYLSNLNYTSQSGKTIRKRKNFNIDEIDSNTNWKDTLDGADCIVHCAARAHMDRKETKRFIEYLLKN
jgi:UDP-glucose 4-epimerase